MNGKPFTEKAAAGLDLFLGEECSSGFFLEEEAGAACLAKLTNPTRGPDEKEV